jgi:NDP-sugar pyrophosphorylase family protein
VQCVIIAGGLGTRMRAVTGDDIPKALLPVAGRPFIDRQLAWLARTGVTSVVLCIGFKGDLVREFVGDGSRWRLRVAVVDEGESLRGTGGALRLAADRGALDERFLVTYGDSFLPIDFGDVFEAFERSGKPGLMTVFRNEGRWDRTNVRYAPGEVMLYDKTVASPAPDGWHHIDYGLSALTRAIVLERIPAGERFDLAVLLHALSVESRLAGYEVRQRFYEVGSPEGLHDLETYVRARGEDN